jgi:OmpA-OmpF porin, OOP family
MLKIKRFFLSRGLEMKKITWILATMAATSIATFAHAEQAAPVDYDCALFNECSDATSGDRGPTKGFSMAGTRPVVEAPKAAIAQPRMVSTPVGRGPKLARVQPSTRPAYVAPRAAAEGVDLQLNFVSGSAELTPGARMSANKLAEAMQRPGRTTTRFMIEGHTDAAGSRESNLDLSRRRAEAVVNYLAAKGVDDSRFDVAGYGFDRPLPGKSALNGLNRRVVAKAIK